MKTEDHEAELTALGAIVLARGQKDHVLSTLSSEDFDHPAHREIFDVMRSITNNRTGVPVSARAVKSTLRARGGKFLDTMVLIESAARDAEAAEHFADVVRERATRRRFLAIKNEIDSISQDSIESAEAIAKLKARLEEIQKGRGYTSSINGLELSKLLAIDLDNRCKLAGKIVGLPTGLIELDQAILGWQPQKFYVVAGRPSSGKTSLAAGSAIYAALYEWKRVLFVSYEMGRLEIGRRLLAADGRVNLRRIQMGQLDAEDWAKIARTQGLLSESRLIIEDRGEMDIDRLCSIARVRHAEQPLDLMLVDYLQLVDAGQKRRQENREQEVARVARKLKQLAMDLGIPVVAVSQLSRKVEERANKRPIMSDLRESGAIEQDADVIMFLYREAAYSDKADPNIAEVNIAKQRDGGVGMFEARWSPEWTRFDNLDKNHHERKASPALRLFKGEEES